MIEPLDLCPGREIAPGIFVASLRRLTHPAASLLRQLERRRRADGDQAKDEAERPQAEGAEEDAAQALMRRRK